MAETLNNNNDIAKKDETAKPLEVIEEGEEKKIDAACIYINNLLEEKGQQLIKIAVKQVRETMLDIGLYIIKHFYSDDPALASSKRVTIKGKKNIQHESLTNLIKKLQNNPEGHKPSRTWLYDAVNLAIDYKLFEAKQLESAYGLLGHSLKVNLTYAPHDNIEFKNKLIKEAVDNKYTVAQLREKIFEEKRKNDVNYISLDEKLDEAKLRTFDKDKLHKIQKETEALKKALEDRLITYNNNLDYIKRSLNIKTTGYPNKYKSNF